MLLSLPLDIKINIAIYNEYLWSLYYIHNEEFKIYSHTLDGKIKYRRAFTIKINTSYPFTINRSSTDYCYKFRNLYHREDDQPAIVDNDGSKRYYYLGKVHRINGPAYIVYELEAESGEIKKEKILKIRHEAWFYENKCHRIDGPARSWHDGFKEYYENGKLHRIGGPARSGHGSEEYYEYGKLHRINGPAIIHSNGYTAWYENGVKLL